VAPWLNEIELKGELVTLSPMGLEHRDALVAAANDGKLWELWFTTVPSEQSIDAYMDKALKDFEADKGLPFVVIDNDTEALIGSTRYFNAEQTHRRLEIGHTWYGKSAQRTGINTECKWLLLNHAFENLHCGCVQFRTHWHNLASRNAIARLGAKQDGVLRNDQVDPAGAFRDTVVFSIIEHEWPAVKQSLDYKKKRGSK
jgi:RimJ/RimL family protein N-acetyltransferase